LGWVLGLGLGTRCGVGGPSCGKGRGRGAKRCRLLLRQVAYVTPHPCPTSKLNSDNPPLSKTPNPRPHPQVCQPFDASKFNFNKAAVEEVLFTFEPAPAGAPASYYTPSARLPASPNALLINVSPIDYGHVLLCPRVLDCLPQVLDRESVLLALRYAKEVGNPYLRVGYNSLGAYATINHLHFQVRRRRGGGFRVGHGWLVCCCAALRCWGVAGVVI